MENYKDLGFNANIQYELTSDDNDFIEWFAGEIHKKLVGNFDYIENNIVVNYGETGDLNVILWPLDCTTLTPNFLTSNAEWLQFCLIMHNLYLEEKNNEREDGD